MSRRGWALAAGLLTVGTAGCLYSPAEPAERRTGVDDVGRAESNAAIRLDVTTRAEVIHRLGSPERVSPDGRSLGYAYNPVTGHRGYVALGGPCGLCGNYPWDIRTRETLWLGFDGAGVLRRWASSRDPHPVDWAAFCAQGASPATRPGASNPGAA